MNQGDDRAQVSWRSRRGMLELDLYLVPFAERQYSALADAEQGAYRELLARDDWEVLDWLQGRSTPPVHLVGIVSRVRAASGAPGSTPG